MTVEDRRAVAGASHDDFLCECGSSLQLGPHQRGHDRCMLFNTGQLGGKRRIIRGCFENGSAKLPWMRGLCLDRSVDINAGNGWLPVALRISKCQDGTAHLDLGFTESLRLYQCQPHLSLEMRGHAEN